MLKYPINLIKSHKKNVFNIFITFYILLILRRIGRIRKIRGGGKKLLIPNWQLIINEASMVSPKIYFSYSSIF